MNERCLRDTKSTSQNDVLETFIRAVKADVHLRECLSSPSSRREPDDDATALLDERTSAIALIHTSASPPSYHLLLLPSFQQLAQP